MMDDRGEILDEKRPHEGEIWRMGRGEVGFEKGRRQQEEREDVTVIVIVMERRRRRRRTEVVLVSLLCW